MVHAVLEACQVPVATAKALDNVSHELNGLGLPRGDDKCLELHHKDHMKHKTSIYHTLQIRYMGHKRVSGSSSPEGKLYT